MFYAFDFKYAGFTIEAAQDQDGKIWIATPTIETTLNYRSNSTRQIVKSKSFKAFAGKNFALVKKRSKSTKKNTTNLYYSEESFLKLVYFELNRARPEAIQLVTSGFITDFHSSVQNAIGNQLDEEQREYLRELVFLRIQCFKAWTDVIKERHIVFYGVKPEGWYYGKLIKRANLALFGVPDFGNDRTENMTQSQQETIKDFESFLVRKARNNSELEPEALLDLALLHFTS